MGKSFFSGRSRFNPKDPFDSVYEAFYRKGTYGERLGECFFSEEDIEEYFENLRSLPHSEYLKTPHWKFLRNHYLKEAKYRCRLCNNTKNLEVHHRTYEHVPHEDDHNDCVVLCNECHAHFHHRLPKSSTEKQG